LPQLFWSSLHQFKARMRPTASCKVIKKLFLRQSTGFLPEARAFIHSHNQVFIPWLNTSSPCIG
jgi:hypothetical protein